MAKGKKKPVEIMIEGLLEDLRAGKKPPWQKPWAAGNLRPGNLSSGRRYRGINPILCHVSDPKAVWWNTIKGWNKLGAKVVGPYTPISFSKRKPYWVTVEEENPETGKVVERKKKKYRYITLYFRVWSENQVEYAEDSKAAALLKKRHEANSPTDNEIEPDERCEAIFSEYVEREGLTFEHGGDRACYSPRLDRVRLPETPSFYSAEGYYATGFHEFAHSTGHPSRLDRFGEDKAVPPFGSEDYSYEELVAEIASSILCAETGQDIPVKENQTAYILGWLKKLEDDPRMIFSAAALAEKAADFILGRGEYEKRGGNSK